MYFYLILLENIDQNETNAMLKKIASQMVDKFPADTTQPDQTVIFFYPDA